MSIVEYHGPTTPQEIRKYLLRRTKDQIVWEYLRLWRVYGKLEAERERRDLLKQAEALESAEQRLVLAYDRADPWSQLRRMANELRQQAGGE